MTVSGIDTLRLYERFKAAKLGDDAAREMAEAFKEAEASRLDGIATKKDIDDLRLEMATMKADLIKWITGILVVQAGVIVALIKLL